MTQTNWFPYVFLFLNCCLGPAVLISLGVYLGRHGMPIAVAWRGRSDRNRMRYTE